MSKAACPQCGCPTPEVVLTPGTDGQGAFTLTNGSFVVPALGGTVTVTVDNSDWMVAGNTYFIAGAGWFTATTIVSPTSVFFTYQNIAENTASGNTIADNSRVGAAATATDGTDGTNSFTFITTGSPNTPILGGTLTDAPVGDSLWMTIGQTIFVEGSGYYEVTAKSDGTHFTGTYLNIAANTNAGNAIADNSQVSPSGPPAALSAPLPNAFTDNSTGTPSDTIAAGVGVHKLEFPHTFIGGTAAVEPVTNYTVGYNFKILSWAFVTEVLLVGAAGSRVANMEINATDVGTVVSTCTIPIANAAVGTVTAGTAVAGANTGTPTDTFSIEIVNGGTQFTAGSGTFVVTIQNMDDAGAFASLAAHVDDLIIALT